MVVLGTPYSVSSARHLGIIAAFAQLIVPAGAEAQLGRHEQQIFHRSGAVDQRMMLVALVGDDDVDRRTIEIIVRAAVGPASATALASVSDFSAL